MSFPVKALYNTDGGAPVMDSSAGSLLSVLDAFLVFGFNSKSISTMTRSGTTVSITTSATHGNAVGQVVLIEGADQADYNGEHRIATVLSATTFTVEVTTTPVTPATGTMTVKRAPAGWRRLYTGTNKSVYAPAVGSATQFCLRVDDTAGANATMALYESMTDIDTGVNPSANFSVWKSSNTGARGYALLADDRFVWLIIDYYNNAHFMPHAVGVFESFKPADAYNVLVGASNTPLSDYPNIRNDLLTLIGPTRSGDVQNNNRLMRSYTQVAGYVNFALCAMHPFAVGNEYTTFGVSPNNAFPNGPDQGLPVSPVYVFESGIRGVMPGVYNPLAYMQGLPDRTEFDQITGLPGKTLRLFRCGFKVSTTYYPHLLLDTVGPWR